MFSAVRSIATRLSDRSRLLVLPCPPGQFLHQDVGLAEMLADGSAEEGGEARKTPVLKVKRRSVPVVKKTRRIYSGAQSVDCWFARNNAAKLIDGRYEDYVVPHMFETAEWREGSNV